MNTRHSRSPHPSLSCLLSLGFLALLLVGCGNGNSRTDKFVAGGAEVTWAETPDHHVRFPLVTGLTWETSPPTKDVLLKVRAQEGPTFVVVASIDDAPKPVALETCAERHRLRVSAAAVAGGVMMTPPEVSMEQRHGAKVPRLHYAVPLEAHAGARVASTMTAWTYVIDGNGRCVGIGVTTVVRASEKDSAAPDSEDLQRLERVFSAVADDVKGS